MENILTIRGLLKRFGGLVAVNDLDMDVKRGEITALIGPNGSGKTTTINLVTKALAPDAGSVVFEANGRSAELTRLREFQIARVGVRRTFQNIRLYGLMDAIDNVKVGGQGDDKGVMEFILRPVKARAEERAFTERARAMLEFVGLKGVEDRIVKELPYGTQKKIEIARALMAEPALVLLDEPATGLNPNERTELVQLILRIRDRGISVLIVEHNMDVVMTISDHVNVLNFGKLIAHGTPKQVQRDPDVIAAYLGSKYMRGDDRFAAE